MGFTRLRGASSRIWSWIRQPWTLALVGLAFFAVLVAAGAALLAADNEETIWLEVAKAAIQAIPVLVLGIPVGLYFRAFEARREDRRREDEARREDWRRKDEHRRRVFGEVTTAYNEIKSIRRWLRAAGLGSAAGAALNAERVRAVDARMDALSDAELMLERVSREIASASNIFSEPAALERWFRRMCRYLRGVVRDWEQGLLQADGGRLDSTRWREFYGFIAPSRSEDSTFDQGASRPLNKILDSLVRDLVGPS